MSSPSRSGVFPTALAGVLILGIAVAFSPRYWPVAVAIGAMGLLGVVWAVLAPSFDLRPAAAPACVAMILLAAWGPAQVGLHLTMAPWLTARSSLNWFGFGIAFLIASQILQGDRARVLFLEIMLWAVTAFAVLALLQMYGSEVPRVYGIFETDKATVGTFLYKNQFAAMLELAAPIALWRALGGRESPVFGLLFFAVLFAAGVASASRAGVILMGVEFLCALVIAVFRRRLAAGAGAAYAGGLVVLLAATSLIAGPGKILEHFQEKNPYSTRRQLLDSTVRMIEERPLAGSGLGTWRLRYPAYATFDNALIANEAHNDWAQWAAEGGIPFSLLMLVVAVSTLGPAFRTTWGLGVPMVMLHSVIDYPTREAALGLLWFTLAGALICTRPSSGRPGERRPGERRKRSPAKTASGG